MNDPGGSPPRHSRHTKIVCTIGPASSGEEQLRRMIEAGMDVARLNLSHGTHEAHAEVTRTIRRLAGELRRPMAIIADLQGPKLRLGELAGELDLAAATTVTLVTRDIPPVGERGAGDLPVPLASLADALKPGSQVTIADGTIRLEVTGIDTATGRIDCTVLDGGRVSSHKGVNVPDVELDVPSLTEKDIADIGFAIEIGVDYIAQSFVQGPEDVLQLRREIASRSTGHRPQVIAKIEKRFAVDRLHDVMSASDAVMVARGDLGVELGAADVPLVQKHIIRRANEMGIPVITATQMLESMTLQPEPTRAEASDVANAILDGTSAVMLSGETAVGRYPVETIRVMDTIARAVEPAMSIPESYLGSGRPISVQQALGDAACEIGELLGAAAIVVLTETGSTARRVARNRPRRPVVAASRDVHTCRRLALDWGVVPVLLRGVDDSEQLNWEHSIEALRVTKLARPGQRAVFTAGTIANRPGMTNMLKVEELA